MIRWVLLSIWCASYLYLALILPPIILHILIGKC